VAALDAQSGQSQQGRANSPNVTEEKVVQDMMVNQRMMNLNHYYTMNQIFTGNMMGIRW
jgi:hypothetical protein